MTAVCPKCGYVEHRASRAGLTCNAHAPGGGYCDGVLEIPGGNQPIDGGTGQPPPMADDAKKTKTRKSRWAP